MSSSTIPRVSGVEIPKGSPWWVKVLVQTLSMIGIPTAICAFLLWERATIIREFSNTIQTSNKLVERMVPVLERLERKVGQ